MKNTVPWSEVVRTHLDKLPPEKRAELDARVEEQKRKYREQHGLPQPSSEQDEKAKP